MHHDLAEASGSASRPRGAIRARAWRRAGGLADIGVDRRIVWKHPGAVGTAPQRDPVARCTRCRRAQSSATLLRAWSRMTDKASELSKTARLRPEPTHKDLGAREAHSPVVGECAGPKLLRQNVKRSRAVPATSLRDVRRRVLETPRASQELGVESFRCVIGMPFVSDVQETHTVSMAASMSTAVQSGAAPPRAPRTSAEGHGARGSSCGCRESVGF